MSRSRLAGKISQVSQVSQVSRLSQVSLKEMPRHVDVTGAEAAAVLERLLADADGDVEHVYAQLIVALGVLCAGTGVSATSTTSAVRDVAEQVPAAIGSEPER